MNQDGVSVEVHDVCRRVGGVGGWQQRAQGWVEAACSVMRTVLGGWNQRVQGCVLCWVEAACSVLGGGSLFRAGWVEAACSGLGGGSVFRDAYCAGLKQRVQGWVGGGIDFCNAASCELVAAGL